MRNNIGEKAARGDIYWIEPSPYRGNGDNVLQARRPGIIVSSDTINKDDFVHEIVYLTTKPKKDLPTYCTIRSSQRVSTAICDQITTISAEQLGSYIGAVTADEMANIERCILISLDMDAPPERKTQTVGDEAAIQHLKQELAKAQGRLEVMQQMYNDLLAKIMDRPKKSRFDNPETLR